MNSIPPRSAGDILRQARQRDSDDKRSRVLAAVDQMINDDEPVTFTAVAHRSQVSRWLVYADGVREHIHAARQRQHDHPRPPDATATPVRAAGLHAEIAALRESHTLLRTENTRLKDTLRRRLGDQLDQIHVPELATRIRELTAHTQKTAAAIEQLQRDNETLTAQLERANEDLLAARVSLRRMIRATNGGNGRTGEPPDPPPGT